MGAALTKPGQASTTRWCGSGERDEKEYDRNLRLRPLSFDRPGIWWMWAGCGAHPAEVSWPAPGELSGGFVHDCQEATVKCCGLAVAMPQG